MAQIEEKKVCNRNEIVIFVFIISEKCIYICLCLSFRVHDFFFSTRDCNNKKLQKSIVVVAIGLTWNIAAAKWVLVVVAAAGVGGGGGVVVVNC